MKEALKRRGQAEMIGLVLIVILLAVGFLLYVRFSTSTKGRNDRAAYEETQLGQTFVNSLAKTSVTCGEYDFTVEELVKAVANGETRCPAESALDDALKSVFNRTLDVWGRNYRFLIVRKTSDYGEEGIGMDNYTNHNYPENERCGGWMERTADYYPIQLYPSPGTVELRLEQCT